MITRLARRPATMLAALLIVGSLAAATTQLAAAAPMTSPTPLPPTDALVWSADPMPEGGTVVDGPTAAKKASKSGGTVTIQSTPWGACGAFTDPDKIVTTYPRKGGTVNGKAIPAGTVDMRCGGPKLSDNPTWGYRHLIAKHKSEWQNRAAVAGENWIDFTDWAIGIVLSDPDFRVYQAGPDNFCYSRTIYLVDKRSGRTVGTAVPRVAFNRKYGDIITAFPPSTNTCTA